MCFMFLIGAKAQVTLGKEQAINMVTITEGSHPHIQEYQLDYRINGEWKPLFLTSSMRTPKLIRE